MWPLGMEGGATRRNWAASWHPRMGKRWGSTRGSPAVGLWSKTDGETPTASWAATRWDHSRGELCSSELPAWEEKGRHGRFR
jgi:hypothetical protein